MRKLRVGLFLAAAAATTAFVACGDDGNSDDATDNTADNTDDTPMIDAAPPDAPPDAPPVLIDAPAINTSCVGTPVPTTAPATITLSGTTQELGLSGTDPVADALVEALTRSNDAVLQADTSDTAGAFSIDLTTGGVPVDGYARISKAGFRRTAVFPPTALAASFEGLPAPLVTAQTFGLLAGFAEAEQNDQVNGALLVLVTDCAGTPVDGATVTATQNGQSVGQLFEVALLQPGTGAYAFFNVPAGTVTIGATYNGTTFLSHDVKAFANSKDAPNGTISATLLAPGYVAP